MPKLREGKDTVDLIKTGEDHALPCKKDYICI